MSAISPNAAPGELELVRTFVNSYDVEERSEALADAPSAHEWLADRGLIDGRARITDADVSRARSVREALRKLLLANNGEALDAAAVRELNAAGERARLAVEFDGHGHSRLTPAERGLDAALGRILAIVATSMADGTWRRLKACPDDACEWAFYDHSKNHSARWCKMSECGNRAKARAYRERKRSTAR